MILRSPDLSITNDNNQSACIQLPMPSSRGFSQARYKLPPSRHEEMRTGLDTIWNSIEEMQLVDSLVSGRKQNNSGVALQLPWLARANIEIVNLPTPKRG